MNLGLSLRSLGSPSTSSIATAMPTMIASSSSVSSATPTSPSASTSVPVSSSGTSTIPSSSLSSSSTTPIAHQSSSLSPSLTSQESPPSSLPTRASPSNLPSSHNPTASSLAPPSSTTISSPRTASTPSSDNPIEVSAAALQTSDSVTTFLPTNTMLAFPVVPSSVSPCVTTCLQNAIISVGCATITSVECYCGKPQFISNAYKCVESQCPADFNQAEDIAEEFCALVSASLTFPSPTATVSLTNTTTPNTASTTRNAPPKTLSVKFLMSSFVLMMALYALQN